MPSLLDRIERVPIDSIHTHPENARLGNIDAIAASLDANQQFVPITVQASTRYVLRGNHTVLAARQLGWTHIDAVLIDVDDHAARKIMLADNRTSDLGGGYDEDRLAELLSQMDGDLQGTLYTDADIERLLHVPTAIGDGTAGLEHDDLWGVAVFCLDSGQRDELMERLGAEGRRVRPLNPGDLT